MPVFECYDYCHKALAKKRKRIERELVKKGLVPRSLKFEAVLYRKLRRR